MTISKICTKFQNGQLNLINLGTKFLDHSKLVEISRFIWHSIWLHGMVNGQWSWLPHPLLL
jgi:hypothetical protein